MHWISGAWGVSLIYAGTTAFPTAKWGIWRNSLPSRLSYRKEDSCCLATWPEWTRQLTPRGFWLVSIRAIGVGLHLLDGHFKERPISAQSYLHGRYRAGLGYVAMETIGSKRSYALTWCMPNNDDEALRFNSNSNKPLRFDSKVMGRGQFENFWIGRACPLLVVVNRLKPLTALTGTVYRLASSISDHMPLLFNMFEDWNEESVVPHTSFASFVINYWLPNARFDLYSFGPSWNTHCSRRFQRL